MPFANNDGIRIHYHVEGSGPPVVLHAGFTVDLEAWYEWGYVDALRPEYRLILIDPRGHGKSDKPHDPAAYEMSLRAGDVLAVLDNLGLQQAHYIGYSMGGRHRLRHGEARPGATQILDDRRVEPVRGRQRSEPDPDV